MIWIIYFGLLFCIVAYLGAADEKDRRRQNPKQHDFRAIIKQRMRDL